MPGARQFPVLAGLLAVPVLAGLLIFGLARAAESSVLEPAGTGPLTLVGSVSFEPRSPAAGQPVTARVRVSADRAVRLSLVVKVRDEFGAFHDFPVQQDVSLDTTARELVLTTTFPHPGGYFSYLAYETPTGWTSLPPWEPFTVA